MLKQNEQNQAQSSSSQAESALKLQQEQDKAASLEKQLAELKVLDEKKSKESQDKEAHVVNLSKENSELQAQCQTYKAEIENLIQVEIVKLKSEYEEVKKQLEVAVAEKQRLSEEIQSIQDSSNSRENYDQVNLLLVKEHS